MLAKLLLLFILVPLAELLLLLYIADQTSFAFTVGLIVATGVTGAALARWQGLRTIARIRDEINQGRPPAGALVDGLLILIAGALLLTPGLLTDLVGFSLLIPPLRAWVKRRVAKRLQASLHFPGPPGGDAGDEAWDLGPRRDEVIDSRMIDREQ